MLDDDLAQKILEREIFLSSVHRYREDIARNDRFPFRSLIGYIYIYIDMTRSKKREEGKDGCVSAAQLCKSITWRGWVVSSRANLHQLLLFTR